ncbi:hypothetical protein GGR55DRAFT_677657 [Xylaria sp. FL0064]|nr:hypothetical protein GGR55DRAFT_677657 [Xylaria sp. FL0064]
MPTSVAQPAHITRPTCARIGCKSGDENLKACSGCFLVHYCSTDCQKQDWRRHKSVCKSILSKASWDWNSRRDAPIRLGEVPPQNVAQAFDLDRGDTNEEDFPGPNRSLFHCQPAVDVLQLNIHEDHSDHPLDILFAGSGDMVDFIQTVANLPMNARIPPIRAVLNDKDFCVSTRNVAILLLAMQSENPKATAELIVQLWYSSFLPIGYLDRILEQLEPHMKNSPENGPVACLCPHQRAALSDPINQMRDPAVLARLRAGCCRRPYSYPRSPTGTDNMWTIGNCSLKYEDAVMPDAFAFLRPPLMLGGNMVYSLRLNQYYRSLPKPWEQPSNLWYRGLREVPREWRVSRKAYFEDCVLLPFGHDRNGDWARLLKGRKPGPENAGNWVHNPFFHGALVAGFAMSSFSDPLEGWPLAEVRKNELAPKNDIYGKLFYFVRDLVEKFIVRLKSIKIDIEIHVCHAEELKTKLNGRQFDRIHASNLADDRWMGTDSVLKSLSPLLKPKSSNPSARLISVLDEEDTITPEVTMPFVNHLGLFNTLIEACGLDDDSRTPRGVICSLMLRHRPLDDELRETIRKWEEKRVRELNRVGAPLRMEVVENALTTPWPYRIHDGVLRDNFHADAIALGRHITSCFYEWQKMA